METSNINNGFPCKTCEIDAQISRVKHENDKKKIKLAGWLDGLIAK